MSARKFGGLTCARIVRGGHFWQLSSIASLATETTGGEILVAFLAKHGLRSDLRVANLSWGSMPPDPPTLIVDAHAIAIPV